MGTRGSITISPAWEPLSEPVTGIEPAQSAWKAEVQNHYTSLAGAEADSNGISGL